MIKNKKEERILIVGSTNHPGCDCIRWDKKDFPSAVDYHLIIIDCTTLPDENKTDFFPANLKILQYDLLDFLYAGHDIFVIADNKKIKIKTYRHGEGREAIIDSFYWSPLPVSFINRSGKHIETIDRFKRYFEFVEGWPYEILHPTRDDLDFLYSRYNLDVVDLNFRFLPFAYNPANRPIAVNERFEIKFKRRPYESPKISGDFFILPPPTKINSKKAIDFILTDIIGKYEELPPPDWVEDYKLPIQPIQKKSKILRKEIRKLYSELIEVDRQLNELLIFRQLLYETGIPLQNIIKKTFEFIGIPVTKPKYTNADHSIEFGNVVFLLEEKGKKDAIDIKDLRQLTSYVDGWYFEKKPTDLDCKGVFVGNPWREDSPKERKKTPFTPKAVEHAKMRHVTLITTSFLFELVVLRMKRKEIDTAKLLNDFSKLDSELTKNAKNYSIL